MKHLLCISALLLTPLLAWSGEHCDAQSFESFAKVFLRSPEFSRSDTAWPIEVQLDIIGRPEATKTKAIAAFNQYWTHSNSPAQYLSRNKDVATSVTEHDKVKAIDFNIPDADFLFAMFFEQRGGCWYFTSITDAQGDQY